MLQISFKTMLFLLALIFLSFKRWCFHDKIEDISFLEGGEGADVKASSYMKLGFKLAFSESKSDPMFS